MSWHGSRQDVPRPHGRVMTDGGDPEDDADDDEPAEESDPSTGEVDRANVEVREPGEAEPADPKWEPPDLDDIPEFEVRAEEPVVREDAGGSGPAGGKTAGGDDEDPTAGMPNTARSPGATRVSTEGAESYVVAMEICAQLPEEVRLPPEAADLVPAAVEAELEQDIEAFAASEFGTQTPTVDTLDFREVDGDIWMRLRIGVPPEAFADLDPEVIRRHALQELEGVL